jgi:hypothetical protein
VALAAAAAASNSTVASSLNNAAAAAVAAANLKKPKTTTSPCAISPVLLECPEQDCSKKYKHANGLKYHQSHAHGSITNMDDEGRSMSPDSPNIQCSNSNPSTEKPATVREESDAPPVKAISIKSVMQLNEVQGKPFNNDDGKTSKSNDDGGSFFESSSAKASQGDAGDGTLEKSTRMRLIPRHLANSVALLDKKPSIQFGLNPDFEQISNDSISEPLQQPTNMNFFQINPDSGGNKVPSAKAKKGVKSPTHEESAEEQHASASENVQSPAYSDISDDSNNAPIESSHLVGELS